MGSCRSGCLVSFLLPVQIIFLNILPRIFTAVVPMMDESVGWSLLAAGESIPNDFDLFGAPLEGEYEFPPSSIHSKISTAPLKPSRTVDLNPSAREAYFLEDLRQSQLTNPDIFYVMSDRREVIDMTGNQSPMFSQHSELREKAIYQSNSIPTYHDPKWEPNDEVMTDMLFIGAWTDIPESGSPPKKETESEKRRPRRKNSSGIQLPTKKPRSWSMRHDEN